MFSYKKFVSLLERTGKITNQVAKDTGIYTSLFSDWKKGRSCPKVDKVKIFADYFNVPIDYFLE